MSDLSGRKVELRHGATAWEPCHISSEKIGKGTNIGAYLISAEMLKLELIVEFKALFTLLMDVKFQIMYSSDREQCSQMTGTLRLKEDGHQSWLRMMQ